MPRYLLILWIASAGLPAGAQSIVAFRNASLEGEARANTAPHDWYYCSFPGESPPDIHPKGLYQVRLPAYDGGTYVGLVCRDNGTFESIGQHLPAPLQAGACYRWGARVARSRRYQAIARSSLQPNSFAAPVRLVLYGGQEACSQEATLGRSEPIAFADWSPVVVILRPRVAIEHLRIGVVPAEEAANNGHVLIDALDPLVPCDCTSGEPLSRVAELAPLSAPDWAQIVTRLDDHLRRPRSGMTSFRFQQRTFQGLAVLYQVYDYLERNDRQLDIGIRLGDRQAYRTIRQQLRNRLDELELPENRLRFKRLNTPATGLWIGANPGSILYLRLR